MYVRMYGLFSIPSVYFQQAPDSKKAPYPPAFSVVTVIVVFQIVFLLLAAKVIDEGFSDQRFFCIVIAPHHIDLMPSMSFMP